MMATSGRRARRLYPNATRPDHEPGIYARDARKWCARFRAVATICRQFSATSVGAPIARGRA